MKMGDNGLEMQALPLARYPDYNLVQFSFRQWITARLSVAVIERAVSTHHAVARTSFKVPRESASLTEYNIATDDPQAAQEFLNE